jgi:hypothetical protein
MVDYGYSINECNDTHILFFNDEKIVSHEISFSAEVLSSDS